MRSGKHVSFDSQNNPKRNDKMILVVDDDKNIRLSLKLILERNDYEVALAEGPKEAMQIVRNTPAVELVLMDMNYTRATDGEEGLTLLKQVKVFRPEVLINYS